MSFTISSPTEDSLVPKLIVFDLDYTLWPFWCDTHVQLPIRPTYSEDKVTDASGDKFGFYKDVPAIIREIKAHPEMEICAASRTQQPQIAQKLLSMLVIDGEPSSTYFTFTAWGTGSKIRHFQELHLHTDVNYEDMLFFDDESRNRDVERQLGVCFIDVPHGMTLQKFHEGIEEWRRRRAANQDNTSSTD